MADLYSKSQLKNKLREIIEKKIQSQVNSQDIYISLNVDINLKRSLGALNETMGKRYQDLLKKLEKDNRGTDKISIEEAKILISGSVDTYDSSGETFNKLGRAFEYRVYQLLKEAHIGMGAQVERENSFTVEKRAYDTLDKKDREQLDKVAAKSVELFVNKREITKDNVIVEIKKLGGSNPLGDLQIKLKNGQSIVMELKYYRPDSNIKYFQLADIENFGKKSFCEFIQEMQNPDIWHTPIPSKNDKGERIKPAESWVNEVRTHGLRSFVDDYLRELAQKDYYSQNRDVALLNYLLAKGKAQVEFSGAKKDIIVGNRCIDGEPITAQIYIDPQAVISNQLVDKLIATPSGVSYVFNLNNQRIANLTTEKSEIVEKALVKGKKRERQKWNSTTFYFYLSKGFQHLSL